MAASLSRAFPCQTRWARRGQRLQSLHERRCCGVLLPRVHGPKQIAINGFQPRGVYLEAWQAP